MDTLLHCRFTDAVSVHMLIASDLIITLDWQKYYVLKLLVNNQYPSLNCTRFHTVTLNWGYAYTHSIFKFYQCVEFGRQVCWKIFLIDTTNVCIV